MPLESIRLADRSTLRKRLLGKVTWGVCGCLGFFWASARTEQGMPSQDGGTGQSKLDLYTRFCDCGTFFLIISGSSMAARRGRKV